MDNHSPKKALNIAAIVLCGGQSTRMGRPKAWLPFGPEFLLQRVVRLAAQATKAVIVVAAHDQELPSLPGTVMRVDDRAQNHGPLEALATGLSALSPEFTHAFLTATDAPFLVPSWIKRLATLIEDDDLAIPVHHSHPQPLAALYRRATILPAAQTLLDTHQRSLRSLISVVKCKKIGVDAFHDIDPNLQTLRNLNIPQDYIDALASLSNSY